MNIKGRDEEMLIIDDLKEQEFMTDIEKSIAQYFIKQEKNLENISTRKIAEDLYVAPSTIVRFCQKLGYNGYADFREAFLKEVDYIHTHFQEFNPNIPFTEKDSDWQIANNIGHLYKETVSDTLSLIDYKTLEKCHALLNTSEILYVFAAGDLIEPAYSFKNKMARIEKKVQIVDRTDMAYVTAAQKYLNISYVLISYSGETSQTVRLAHFLKREEIPFIAITSFGENTLTKLATYTLHLSSREKLINNLGNFSSVLSTMYLLDVLYSTVLGSDYQKNYKHKVKVAQNYEQYRRSSNPLLND